MAAAETAVATSPEAHVSAPARETRRALWAIYRRALRRYVPAPGDVLPRSIERTEDGWIVHEACPLNTAEMVKAAFMMQAHGVEHPFDPQALLDGLIDRHLATADYSVVSLSLWAAALGRSPHGEQLWSMLVDKLPADASQSMQLGWTLGAVSAYREWRGDCREVQSLARNVIERLVANQDARSGLFYASARREGWLRRRRADTTLSSQTYPILGLVMYARAFGTDDMLLRARQCADRLCALQGPQGQWWWRFDARRGTMRERYPVYSVNQDSAIPNALGQLQRALGDNRYDASIGRGLEWLAGRNEADATMLDERRGFVARSLESGPDGVRCSWEMYAYQPARYVNTVLGDPAWAAEVTT